MRISLETFFHNQRREYGPLKGMYAITYMPSLSIECELKRTGDCIHFVQKTWQGLSNTALRAQHCHGDPEALRDGLERICTPEEACQYLSLCGPWYPPVKETQTISWDSFLAYQDYFRARRTGQKTKRPYEPSSLLKSVGKPMRVGYLEGRTENFGLDFAKHLTTWIECSCALEAISAIVEIECLQEVVYQKCANKNCPRAGGLFVYGRTGAKYCETKCRKAAFERNDRQRKKSEQQATEAAHS